MLSASATSLGFDSLTDRMALIPAIGDSPSTTRQVRQEPVYRSNVRGRLDTKQAATLSTAKAKSNTTNAVPDIHSAHTRTTLHLFPRAGSLVEGNSLRQETDKRGMCVPPSRRTARPTQRKPSVDNDVPVSSTTAASTHSRTSFSANLGTMKDARKMGKNRFPVHRNATTSPSAASKVSTLLDLRPSRICRV